MDRPLLKGFVMKLTHALALSAFVAAAAATLPATAQSYSAPQSASFYSEDHGREARILLGSNTGILPGDVAEIFDGEGKPTGLTFKIFKVQATEARGKLEGQLTQDRLDQARQAAKWTHQARFSRQPANRTKCQPTVPAPIKQSDVAAIQGGRAPAGYVVASIDLKQAIEGADNYAIAHVGTKQMALPKTNAFIVSGAKIYPAVTAGALEHEIYVNIEKVDIRPGTFGMAFASQAKVVIPVSVCN